MFQSYFKHDSMPRSARLDQPGLLQYVIVRGIEKRDIFLDDEDRDDFVRRLSTLLLETQTECLAWVLMAHHAHLLLRPKGMKLARLMRMLNMSQSGVSIAADRGEAIIRDNPSYRAASRTSRTNAPA